MRTLKRRKATIDIVKIDKQLAKLLAEYLKDMKLHVALAEIAGNPVYMSVLKMVHEKIMGLYEEYSFRGEKVLKKNYDELCNIVNAVEKGNAEEARSLAQDHVRYFNRYMKEENEKS